MTPREVVESFWETMRTNDFHAAGRWLADDFECHWPQSSEVICGRVNFAELNSNYPAKSLWQFDLVSLICEGDTVVTDVKVTDGNVHARAITFHSVKSDLITRQTEFWPDDFAPPSWRRQWVKLQSASGQLEK
ncbi:MAG: nuclear transport factor 2 family protein [Candidatus Riflebacteria bacterium]|nr:nuclear transport factor 2 family protein [Candidatus Riflebacteria bacterium]